ncbi:MAG: tRNA pseudouridine(38-40) synthase TruA [Defluviitaleaceae bacterium]|nr:tRNA pseudouridine(38-40) synthase TruA [Defluviitaleaceae bacterium]
MQILLTVAYDGTAYAGWQRQQNAIAVQQRLEEALSTLLSRPITINAASRTDAGVHALGQRAAFFADDLRVSLKKLPQVINGLLPPDISVTAAQAVCDNFNPRFDAEYKIYTYNTYCAATPNPLLRRYSAYVPQMLDIQAMKKAAGMFAGRHDFAAFMATGSSAKTTVREIFSCDVRETQPGLIALTITGNGFLYNMVRIIAGTVLYVGLGKILPQDIPMIISSCDRTKAGKTMPPEGLTLVEVGYKQDKLLCNG